MKKKMSLNKYLLFGLPAASLVYLFVYGVSFWLDPLGRVAVLDARENIAWAQWIREGVLPAEPLYRALLYPWLLSLFAPEALPEVSIALGLFFHAASACLVGLIARCLWAYPPAAWFSGLLYAIYPVALFFAGQTLDITMATTLFLAGVFTLVLTIQESRPSRTLLLAALAGLFVGLAVLARPNFLPAAMVFPCVLLWTQSRPWRAASAVTVALLLVLILQGLFNLRLSGDFRILPWQGAYNLYAANREGANGKYYMQRLVFDSIPRGSNPTRMESEFLYREANPGESTLEIDAMNRFWRSELIDDVTEDPLRWGRLMLRKGFYLINDWEQYNNLTYAYHKARLPTLHWNPLGWGALLLLASAGLFFGFRAAKRSSLFAIGFIALAYTAGLLLFFVSARFRLPLAPLLCLAAGGCAYFPRNVLSRSEWKWLACCLVTVALLSFGNWYSAKDRGSFIQDDLLLARAYSEIGGDREALELSRKVLEVDQTRAAAQRLEVVSLFNLWLQDRASGLFRELRMSLRALDSEDAAILFIRGVVSRLEGKTDVAVEYWREGVSKYGSSARSCQDALQAIGEAPIDPSRQSAVQRIRAILDRSEDRLDSAI